MITSGSSISIAASKKIMLWFQNNKKSETSLWYPSGHGNLLYTVYGAVHLIATYVVSLMGCATDLNPWTHTHQCRIVLQSTGWAWLSLLEYIHSMFFPSQPYLYEPVYKARRDLKRKLGQTEQSCCFYKWALPWMPFRALWKWIDVHIDYQK